MDAETSGLKAGNHEATACFWNLTHAKPVMSTLPYGWDLTPGLPRLKNGVYLDVGAHYEDTWPNAPSLVELSKMVE